MSRSRYREWRVIALMAGVAAGALSLHRTRQAPRTPLLFEDELPTDVTPLRLNPA